MKKPVEKIIEKLQKAYPRVKVALHFSSPFEILVATILSAQCTDERVNIVTTALFKKYRSIKDYATANPKELEKDIHSTGFFRNKTKNIIGSAQRVLSQYGGKVPDTMEEILTLPGVARKTANIVLSNAYGIYAGIAVDTHVIRLANLLGLTRNANPVKIEQDLMAIVPKNKWPLFSLLLQAHGRAVCIARRPQCKVCTLNLLCPSAVVA